MAKFGNYPGTGQVLKERCLQLGDDRFRRERLVPKCEPSGAELVNSAQTIKCQQH